MMTVSMPHSKDDIEIGSEEPAIATLLDHMLPACRSECEVDVQPRRPVHQSITIGNRRVHVEQAHVAAIAAVHMSRVDGSFSFRAKRDGAIGKGAVGLRSLQDCEHSGCTTQMKQAAADGGDRLAVASAQTETGAALVIASAEPLGGIESLEAAHTLDPTFDAPVILLQAIGSGAGLVWHLSAQC